MSAAADKVGDAESEATRREDCNGQRCGSISTLRAQMMFRVTDLERSIKYYTECLGMKHLRTRENEKARTASAPLPPSSAVRKTLGVRTCFAALSFKGLGERSVASAGGHALVPLLHTPSLAGCSGLAEVLSGESREEKQMNIS